jgi:hypothetical protein
MSISAISLLVALLAVAGLSLAACGGSTTPTQEWLLGQGPQSVLDKTDAGPDTE